MKSIKKVKVILFVMLCLCAIILIACSKNSSDTPKNYFSYTVNPDGNTCTVTGLLDFEGDKITVGGSIDGYEIIAISSDAFANCNTISYVTVEGSVKEIGAFAFMGCESLKGVALKDGVEHIGDGAFYGCVLLEDITVPKTVNEISDRMLYNCTSLATFNIPESINRIGKYAFGNCTALDSIAIPKSVTEIDWYAFSGCDGLSAVHIFDIDVWYKIKFETPESNPLYYAKNLYLDSKIINELTVTGVNEISPYAFYNCESINFVYLRTNVESIGDCAFFGCKNLTEFSAEGGLYSIGASAFENCVALDLIFLPSELKIINNNAFKNCGSGKILYSGTENEWNSFVAKGKDWGDITVVCSDSIGDTTEYESDGFDILINRLDNTCTIVGIGSCEDKNLYINNVYGYRVTKIDKGAFESLSQIKSVTMSHYILSAGEGAFAQCKNLESVYMSVLIEVIENSLFMDCASLKSIELPLAYTIGDYAFFGCESLGSINIPISVEKIGIKAFAGCYSLKDVYYDGTYSRFESIEKGGGIFGDLSGVILHCADGNYKLDEEGNGEFVSSNKSSSTGLDFVVNEDGYTCTVTGIGSCTDTELVIGICMDSSMGNFDGYQVTAIDSIAFMNNKSIQKVIILDGVTTIGNDAFRNCSSLNTVIISESVTSIGTYAFKGCDMLQSIELPNSIKMISANMFYHCVGLKRITIPDSVKTISENGFAYCKAIESIQIPSSVETINYSAFESCSALKSVYYDGSLSEWKQLIKHAAEQFKGTEGVVLYCNDGAYNIDENGDVISDFVSVSDGLEYTINDDYATCTITGIGACTDKEIIIGGYIDGYLITSIGDGAFKNADINSLLILDSVNEIGEYAFERSNLTSVILGKNVSVIGQNAFQMTDITEIIIPNNVTNIKNGAFFGCSSLKNIIYDGSADDWIYLSQSNSGWDEGIYGYTISFTEQWQTTSGSGGLKYDVEHKDVYCTVTGIGAFEGSVVNIGQYIDGYIVSAIDDYAFADCVSITKLKFLGNYITKIGEGAFGGCTSIKTVEFGGSLSQWNSIEKESGCFKGTEGIMLVCTDGSYIIDEDGNKTSIKNDENDFSYDIITSTTVKISNIGGYKDVNIVIPDKVKGYTIVGIGDYAFISTPIQSVIISNKITDIGKYAFEKTQYLSYVYIPTSVKSIGEGAFANGADTLIIDYDDTVSKWEKLIGTSCECLIDSAYVTVNCTDGYVSYEMGEVVYKRKYEYSSGFTYSINSSNMTCTIMDLGKCQDSVLVIGGNIDGYKITKIADKAFEGCDSITEVIIMNDIEYIGRMAFEGCKNLKKVEITADVKSMGTQIFWECTSLTDVYIEEGVEVLGDYMFAYCSALESISIPEGVTSIGKYVFDTCTKLNTVDLPRSLTKIGSDIFIRCGKLEVVNFSGTLQEWWSVNMPIGFSKNMVFDLVCLDGVISVDTDLAYCAVDLYGMSVTDRGYCNDSKVIVPDEYNQRKVLGINEGAFKNDLDITDLTVGKNTAIWGSEAFFGCENLSSVTILGVPTTFGEKLFFGCTALTKIYFSGSISEWHSIDKADAWNPQADFVVYCSDGEVFYDFEGNIIPCKVIESMEFDYTMIYNKTAEISGIGSCTDKDIVTYSYFYLDDEIIAINRIGDDSFANQVDIKSVTISNNIKIIGHRAFMGCEGLEVVILNSTDVSLGKSAFAECSSLERIVFCGTMQQWNSISKDIGWRNKTNVFTVECTDGEIVYS